MHSATGITSRAAVKETSPSPALLDDVANKISAAIERVRSATGLSSQVADSIFGAIPHPAATDGLGYDPNPNARGDVVQSSLGVLHDELGSLEMALERLSRI